MELSISDASGWRPQQPSVVAQYVATFPEEYGRTITAGVTVVSKDSAGDPAVDQDGTFIIDDGKSTVAALQKLLLLWMLWTGSTCCPVGCVLLSWTCS